MKLKIIFLKSESHCNQLLSVHIALNPYLTNGFSHQYQLDESTFIFCGLSGDFYLFISFFDEISLCKHNSPSWDAAFCGATSGAMLFAYVP